MAQTQLREIRPVATRVTAEHVGAKLKQFLGSKIIILAQILILGEDVRTGSSFLPTGGPQPAQT